MISGSSLKEQVYSLLRKTMSDCLAAQFNWKGTGDKLAFGESNLCGVITGKCYLSHRPSCFSFMGCLYSELVKLVALGLLGLQPIARGLTSKFTV